MPEWLKRQAMTLLPPLAVLLAAIVLWDMSVRWSNVEAFIVPAPGKVAAEAWKQPGILLAATGRTALAALCGFGASLALGTVIAFVFSQSRAIRMSCYPYAVLLQTVPIVAVAPLIVLWYGSGFFSVCLVATIISLFPIITNATTGMVSVDPELLELFRLHRASRLQMWWKLRLPNAVPHILTGARTSSGLAVIGAIVGEFFTGYGTSHFGLGYLIQMANLNARTAQLFACVIASGLLGIAIFGAMSGLQHLFERHWGRVSDRS